MCALFESSLVKKCKRKHMLCPNSIQQANCIQYELYTNLYSILFLQLVYINQHT